MQSDISYASGKEKRIGSITNAPQSVFCSKSEPSVLQNLLAASKDAEVLIACMFEQHLFTAAPLYQIGENLAAAIDEAQFSIRAERPDAPSAPSSRGYRERRP
jgi:hypothetical protein